MREDELIQNMVEEDRTRFRVGGGPLHFRRAQQNEGYSYFQADEDIAVLHCSDGQETPTQMTCVVLSRYRVDEMPVYIGQCVCCGTVWIAGAPVASSDVHRGTNIGV